MKTLLIILLIATAAATGLAVSQILNLAEAPLLPKVSQVLYIICSLASAVMLIYRKGKAVIPYLIGFMTLLIVNFMEQGAVAIANGIIGYLIIILFFTPAVQKNAGVEHKN
jgi:hypothetical protein